MTRRVWWGPQRRRMLLAFIQTYYETNGVPPTVKEMAQHFGFRSVGTISRDLAILRRAGMITSDPKRARSTRVLKPVRPWKGAIREEMRDGRG